MTLKGDTLCQIIQAFPVLLILAQNSKKCLNTPLIYKPPPPTQSPDFLEAYDALLHTLLHKDEPCQYPYSYTYTYGRSISSEIAVKQNPCQYYPNPTYSSVKPTFSHAYPTFSHGYPTYSHEYPVYSHGTPSYSHAFSYGNPYLRKGKVYNGTTGHGHRYASNQVVQNVKYKVVVKKTKIGNGKRRRSQKLRGVRVYSCDADKACIYISECEYFSELVKIMKTDPSVKEHLKKVVCGFEGKRAKVCCPRMSSNDTNVELIDGPKYLTNSSEETKTSSALRGLEAI